VIDKTALLNHGNGVERGSAMGGCHPLGTGGPVGIGLGTGPIGEE
jgi:hypothetical protein